MKILFLGDVVGKPGRRVLEERLSELQRSTGADFTIVNGENAAGGRGITPTIADEFFALDVDVITTGNHVWAQSSIAGYLPNNDRLLRPDNYPAGAPGAGVTITRSRRGVPVAVINLQGRVFMPDIDCPFKALDSALEEIGDRARLIVLDIHAEATSEKQAMGWYCDGRATAVLGTHTHVPTADARLLPGGTAYCTDVGMTGPYDSVIGTRPDLALERFLTARPVRFQVASSNLRLAGVLIEADPESGLATSIQQILDPPGEFGERFS